jgi:hypothetical protein
MSIAKARRAQERDTVVRGFLAKLYVGRHPVLEVQPDASGYAVSNERRHCVLFNDRGRACFSYIAKRGSAYTYSSVMLDVPSLQIIRSLGGVPEGHCSSRIALLTAPTVPEPQLSRDVARII